MKGPEHFAMAEEALIKANTLAHAPTATLYAQIAGAHATLALTAATIDAAYEVDTDAGWEEVLRGQG